MIVYQGSKNDFTKDVLNNIIEEKIYKAFQESLGRKTSSSEISSWRNSMMYMNNIMIDPEIPEDSKIAIEYQIPLTSKRVDFLISGKDAGNNETVVVIELKQWQEAKLNSKDAIVSTWMQGALVETSHPSYQAWSYVQLINGFNETVQEENIFLQPCAYLHNYNFDDQITNVHYKEYIDKAPLFLKADALKLREFIKKYIRHGDDSNILFRIDNGKLKPSKQLADSLSSMLRGNEEFIMIDDQKLVYETAIEMARKASPANKQVLIVEGGPGTGKSVVAINLLVNLTKQGLVSQYVTKNAAPRAVYASKLTGTIKKTAFNNLFRSSGGFIDSEENQFDALIVDEAHRLNLKSGLYGNLGVNQVLEIISASKFSIFFVDDHQQIHIKDIGEVSKIREWAEKENGAVRILKLQSQFRCNGSDGYLGWLDNILGIRETANDSFDTKEYDFRVFDNPNELRTAIEERNKFNNKSRMVAGYCWDWLSKKDSSIKDVTIPEYDFGMTWNLTKDGSNWIIAENSINEIGCIHTCQGLELDYVGVIIGQDLLYENGEIATNVLARSKMDQSIRGIKKMIKEDPDRAFEIANKIILNTYRVLMTRGMKGCYVYCLDQELSKYLKSRVLSTKEYRIEPIELSKVAENKSDYLGNNQ
ncbi:MAG: DUF2075 domain-containing protein [Saprospiraceae bacterium]|nr:DUF2075 domain-containing protein [Saprospiraceae bacterium]